ncbi:MAG TPA: hypothetical protein VJG49_04300 [Candidatus Nanoarchaeia archaeon]|nr:hypothetical protein [Candidatus Nanoarchaeia archaeon]
MFVCFHGVLAGQSHSAGAIMIASRMLIGIEMKPLIIRVQPDGPQVAFSFRFSLPFEFWQSYFHRYSL